MTEAAQQREPEREPANGSEPVRVIVWYDYI